MIEECILKDQPHPPPLSRPNHLTAIGLTYCPKSNSQISKIWEPRMSKNMQFWEVFKLNRMRVFIDTRTTLYKHNIHILCWGVSTAKRVALAQTPVHRIRIIISVRPSFRGCGEDDEPTRCILLCVLLFIVSTAA